MKKMIFLKFFLIIVLLGLTSGFAVASNRHYQVSSYTLKMGNQNKKNSAKFTAQTFKHNPKAFKFLPELRLDAPTGQIFLAMFLMNSLLPQAFAQKNESGTPLYSHQGNLENAQNVAWSRGGSNMTQPFCAVEEAKSLSPQSRADIWNLSVHGNSFASSHTKRSDSHPPKVSKSLARPSMKNSNQEESKTPLKKMEKGADVTSEPNHPCPDPALSTKVRQGWELVKECVQLEEKDQTECQSDYLLKLANLAGCPEDLNRLYAETELVGAGGSNRFYRVITRPSEQEESQVRGLRVGIYSRYGYGFTSSSPAFGSFSVPEFLRSASYIEAKSTPLLDVQTYFPKIYKVFLRNLPEDVEKIKVMKGTDLARKIIPPEMERHILERLEIGQVSSSTKIIYVDKDMVGLSSQIVMLPCLAVEMEYFPGGTLKDQEVISQDIGVEMFFMGQALAKQCLSVGDTHLHNVVLADVDYQRAYHLQGETYLFRKTGMPKFIDLDYMRINGDLNCGVHIQDYLSPLRKAGNLERGGAELIEKLLNVRDLEDVREDLQPYLVSKENLQSRQKIQHYYLDGDGSSDQSIEVDYSMNKK